MDRKLIMLKSPNLILAGFGALEKMGEEARNLEAKKALLVTDKGIIASGVSAKVEKVLTDQKIAVEIFDQVIPDPDIACCEKCIDTSQGRPVRSDRRRRRRQRHGYRFRHLDPVHESRQRE